MAARYMEIEGGFDGFHDFVNMMNRTLGIQENLTALGVHDPDIDALVASALADPSVGGNPVEMTTKNTSVLLESCL